MSEKKYKYIIIDTTSDEVVLKKSYREIADFINTISEKDIISHNTVRNNIKETKFFYFNELLIKVLIW